MAKMINKRMKFPKYYKSQDGKYGSGNPKTDKGVSVNENAFEMENFVIEEFLKPICETFGWIIEPSKKEMGQWLLSKDAGNDFVINTGKVAYTTGDYKGKRTFTITGFLRTEYGDQYKSQTIYCEILDETTTESEVISSLKPLFIEIRSDIDTFMEADAKEQDGENIYYTTAPKSYDTASIKTIEETDWMDKNHKPVRKIHIPEKDKDWQVNRNASGNYPTFTSQDFNKYKDTLFHKKETMSAEKKVVETMVQTEKNKSPLADIEIQNAEIKNLSYESQSDSCVSVDTIVPASMRYDMHKAIETIDRRVNGVDEYVAEKLGYVVGNCSMEERKEGLKCLCDSLSAEQVDAVAVAIYNIEQKGQGCIIGDQTGIGKGRIAGAMIRYGVHRGLKPIFLTEKPTLFSDLFRDIINIGSDDDIPLEILVGTKQVEKKLVKETIDDDDAETETDNEEEQTEFVIIPVYEKNPDYPNSYTFTKTDENGVVTQHTRTRKKSMRPFIINGRNASTNIKDEEGHILYKGNDKEVRDVIGYNERTKNEIGKTKSGKIKYASKTIKGTFGIPEEYDFVLATYSQFQGVSQSKMDYLLEIAKGNIIIMDESHNASGDSNVGVYLRNVLAETLGVTFLSATFSKRPDNMPIYAGKTAMSDANMTSEDLVLAIEKGGVALQEIVSSNLVAEGQMLRRERSFEGIEVNYEYLDASQTKRGYDELNLEQKHRAIMDIATDIIRRIIAFQRDWVDSEILELDRIAKAEYKEVGGRKGTSMAGVDNAPMFSGIFNIINQLLFSIKAEAVGFVALARLKEGKKPVIAFANTMESFLNTMSNDDGTSVRDGNIVNSDFSKIFEKRLTGVLRYTTKDADGDPKYETIDVTAMSPEFQYEYNSILNTIKNASVGISSSPIDVLINTIEKGGYSVVEVTGRARQLKILGNDKGQIKSRLKVATNDAFRRFNTNEVDCLLINQSGSTGASAHALPNAKVPANKVKQRVLIVLQAELNISTEVQKRGRINRTGQILKPIYDYVISAIPSEKRLMMMLQKKLKSLDANTTSSQKTSEELMDTRQVDFLNKYGDEIVVQYLKENPLINETLGDPLKLKGLKDDEVPSGIVDGAHKVSGRVSILSTKDQDNFYTEIAQRYVSLVEYLIETQEYDLEVSDMDLEAETLEKEIVVVGKGGESVFGRHSILEKCKVNNLKKPYHKTDVDRFIKEGLGQSFTSETLKGLGEKLRDKTIAKYEAFVKNNLSIDIKETEEWYNELIKDVPQEKAVSKIKDAKERTQFIAERREALETAKTEQIDKLKTQTENKKEHISRLLNFFYVGRVCGYPTINYNQTFVFDKAIFVGFTINENIKNPYTPSAMKMKFVIASSQKFVGLPASKFDIINMVRSITLDNIFPSEQEQVINDWDEIIKGKSANKVNRYIVTGNILQAYGKDELKGTLVSYTTSTGGLKKGILLPETFTKDKQGEKKALRISVPIIKALPIIKRMMVGRAMITNDLFSFIKHNNGYRISVPASKQRGGKFYLDETIMKFTTQKTFDKRGADMVADVEEKKIENLVEYMQDKFNNSVELLPQEFDTIKGDLIIEDYSDEEKRPETDVFVEKLTEVDREGAEQEKAKAFEEEQKGVSDALEQAERDKKEGAEFEIEKRKLSAKKKLINLVRILNNEEVLMRRGGNTGEVDITNDLESFDLNNLDPFETMQYEHTIKSHTKAESLQIAINNVEGDYSQLSPELSALAQKQKRDYSEEYKGGGKFKKIKVGVDRNRKYETSKDIEDWKKKAYEIGVSACKNNKPRVPAQSVELMELMQKTSFKSNKTGDSIEVMKAFGNGYFDENQKETRKLFPRNV